LPLRLGLVLTLVAGCSGCATDVTTLEAHRLVLAGARLLDVRSPSEYAERHARGAVNIPIDELKRRMGELGGYAQPIVVYCHTGARSGIAVHWLRNAGYTAVFNLGSLGHWSHEHPDRAPSLLP
jgi:rhodanese-related sulfurtransferase